MMTRREKLLVRPWQLKRYNNHKKKVLNAVPRIDFGPPPQRRHVTVKLKKLQKEKERQMKIEEDNFKLLQNLGSIMSKKRMDDYWVVEPPTFLRRVGIYHRTRTPSPCEEISPVTTPEASTIRKSRCQACTPYRKETVTIPEERIPWQTPKKIINRKQSTITPIPMKSDFQFPQVKKTTYGTKSNIKVLSETKDNQKTNANYGKKLVTHSKSLELPSISPNKSLKNIGDEQKIILRQGSLQISLNFSSLAEVKLIQGTSEKLLQRNVCECKRFQPIKSHDNRLKN